MAQNVLQWDALLRIVGEALRDQVHALFRNFAVKVELAAQNLIIILKGDVTAHHVVQQDAQRPDGGS